MSHTVLATPLTTASQPFSGVEARLTFIRRSDAKPVLRSAALTGGAPRELFETQQVPVPIGYLRPSAGTLSLDREGFVLLRHGTAVADFYDDDQVERVYHPEIEALLRRPASRVHVDYTESSGPQRVRDLLGEAEAVRLADAGARTIRLNVWRPIRGPVERSPLALADASSVRFEDLIATDQVFTDRVGEIYHLAHRPSQRWYYASRMTVDEVVLIKGWDCLENGRTRFTPHGAFELPDTPADAATRESIEVRTLVVIGAEGCAGRPLSAR